MFLAAEGADLVQRSQALFGLGQVAGDQVQLARVLERAAVFGVDAQRFVVERLGGGGACRQPAGLRNRASSSSAAFTSKPWSLPMPTIVKPWAM